MTSRDFCYWLQGYFEIEHASHTKKDNISKGLIHEKVVVIENHLKMVFAHEIDPSQGGPEEQAKLNKLHGGDPTPRC